MQIKKFKANSMREALKMVKHEFGPEAVILSAKNIENDKKIFNFKKYQGVVITAAMDIQSLEKETNNSLNMISKSYGPHVSQTGSHGLKRKYNFIDSLCHGGMSDGIGRRSSEKANRFSNRGFGRSRFQQKRRFLARKSFKQRRFQRSRSQGRNFNRNSNRRFR